MNFKGHSASRTVLLPEVVELNPRSFTVPISDGDPLSFVPMKVVEEESGRMNPSEVKSWKEVKKGYTPFQNGDVVFAKITPCMENGKYALACDLHGGRGAGSTEFHVFRPRQEIDAHYLLHFLFSDKVRVAARLNMRGAAGQLRVPISFFEQLQIPLPPLDEQCAIVAEIEKQFTRLEAGVDALKRVQANLKRYRAAVLKSACEGKLFTTAEKWPQKPIADVIESMEQGWSPKCESEPSIDDSTWAVIKTTAIQNLRFIEVENKRLPSSLKPRSHIELFEGDLLVTRAGPRNRVGVACLIKKGTRPRLMLCDKAYRLRCKLNLLMPAFLELVLNAPHIVDAVSNLKTGISDSGVNLTQKRFGELFIPLPSLSEQKRIVEEVERRLSVIEELEATVSTNLQRATRLRQSILQKAFN